MKTIELDKQELELIENYRKIKNQTQAEFLSWWGQNSFKARDEFCKEQYCKMEQLKLMAQMVWSAAKEKYLNGE